MWHFFHNAHNAHSCHSEWSKYDVLKGLDQYEINEIRAEIYTSFTEFSNFASDTSKSERLRKFSKLHENIIICTIDKSKNICIFALTDYISKFNEVFDPLKLKKLTKNQLEANLRKYRKIALKLNPYLSIADRTLIQPT